MLGIQTDVRAMPTRILRDWTDSEAVNALTAQGERHFLRVIMKADDYGRLTGSAKLLRPLLYPLLLDEVREADVQRWTAECVKSGLVRLYEVDSKPFLEIQKFGQRIRAEKSKCPSPDGQMTDKRQSTVSPPRTYANGEGAVEGALPPAAGKPPKKPRKKATGAHAELIEYYVNSWKKRYGRKYPFRDVDGVKAAELLELCGGALDDAKAVIDRYLADTGKFFNGHSLALLTSASQLPKFIGVVREEEIDLSGVKFDPEPEVA